MTNKNQMIKTQSDQKHQSRAGSAIVDSTVSDHFEVNSSIPRSVSNKDFAQATVGQLNSRHMQGAQRCVLATHIGQLQGNQHLQRIITPLKYNDEIIVQNARRMVSTRSASQHQHDSVEEAVITVGETAVARSSRFPKHSDNVYRRTLISKSRQVKDKRHLQRRDFEETSENGDTLRVQVATVEPNGTVRNWAIPRIISSEGDVIRFHCQAEVTNRPFQVIVGIRNKAKGEALVQSSFLDIKLRRWLKEGLIHIPRHARPQSPADVMELFVRLQPSNASAVEFNAVLQHNQSAVELSRILHAEASQSLAGMLAVAHAIQNRLNAGQPAAQIDSTSPWPDNFINTGFGLNLGRARNDWPRVTSSASRELANRIIQNGEVPGNDPTGGARFYRATRASGLENSNQFFIRLRQNVEAGRMRRISVGGNTFYAPVTSP